MTGRTSPPGLEEQLAAAGGLEGVGEVLNFGRALRVGPDNGDDIEPPSDLKQMMLVEEVVRGPRDPALLLGRDGLGRLAPAPGFHLDEDKDVAIAGDQIDLAGSNAIAPGDDPQALAAEESGRRPLAAITKPTVPGHPNRHQFAPRWLSIS